MIYTYLTIAILLLLYPATEGYLHSMIWTYRMIGKTFLDYFKGTPEIGQAVAEKQRERYDRIKKQHTLFIWSRVSFYGMVFGVFYFMTDNIWQAGYGTLAGLLLHPFMHLGMYYKMTNKFTPGAYPLEWIAETDETNADVNIPPVTRTIMFVAGFILLALNYFQVIH